MSREAVIDFLDPVMDLRTPYAALDGMAVALSQGPIANLQGQLEACGDLTPAEREQALAKARPMIVAHTRAMLQRAWEDLQIAGQVH